MDENLRRAADELLSALHETESWKRYAALRESVMADEGTAALLRRFAAAQSALQMAAQRPFVRQRGGQRISAGPDEGAAAGSPADGKNHTGGRAGYSPRLSKEETH